MTQFVVFCYGSTNELKQEGYLAKEDFASESDIKNTCLVLG
jgi:hypothetical protein